MNIEIITPATDPSALNDCLRALVRAIHKARPETREIGGFLGGADGYGVDIETSAFEMRAHTEDPPDCDCEPGKQTGNSVAAWYHAGMPHDRAPLNLPCTNTCAGNLPNFKHKASGFEVRWHKWIGRSMETQGTAPDLSAMLAECVASLAVAR